MKCDRHCVEVGFILYGANRCEDCCPAEREYRHYKELMNYSSYKAISEEKYGYINYALAAYCVSMGHLECLKKNT